MCDALVWLSSNRRISGVPVFTSRVNVADGGVDAEWSVGVPDENVLPSPMIQPGWNVFQYKQRDTGVRDKGEIISRLQSKDNLGGALVKLVKEHEKTPSNYVLFVNIDLDPGKRNFRQLLKEAILNGYFDPDAVRIEIAGAAEIASMLNNFPHLRAAYFSPLSFKTWQTAHTEHHRRKRFGAELDALIGRDTELDRIRALVNDPHCRVIVLAGPHDIGKSRLALEATAHRPHDSVLASDPRSMALQDYRHLAESPREVVCIVEDPEAEGLSRLIDEALTLDNMKLLITLPTQAYASMPSYGRDDRVQTVVIKPLEVEHARKLLRAAGHPLDFELEDWIIEHAGGIPGVLLAAASMGMELRNNREDFEQNAGNALAARIESDLGDEALQVSRLLSCMTHVGIRGSYEEELKHLVRIFGNGLTTNEALVILEKKLIPSGLAKVGGSFATITVPLLANYLVVDLLRGRRNELFVLFGGLEESGRMRLLKRISGIRSEETKQFWESLFTEGSLPAQLRKDFDRSRIAGLRYQETDGDNHNIWEELYFDDSPLYDLNKGIQDAQILEFLAGVEPLQTIDLIESILLDSDLAYRLSITRERRRDLIKILEQLMFRVETSRRTLHLIWLLAEAENEPYANNATGVLTECLNFRHWQMPLPLRDRLEALRTFTNENQPKRARLVAVNAAGNIFEDRFGYIRHSSGSDLLDSRPAMIYKDVWDYSRDVIDLLFGHALAEDQEISEAAQSALPRMIGHLANPRFGRPEEAVERLIRMLDLIQEGSFNTIEITAAANTIHTIRYYINGLIEQNTDIEKFRNLLNELDQQRQRIIQGSFELRIKRWTGTTAWEDRDVAIKDMEKGQIPFEEALSQLADEVIQNLSLLESSVNWLLSPSAHGAPHFFQLLGCKDKERRLLSFIKSIGKEERAAGIFASYWRGWAQENRHAAESHLIELNKRTEISGSAIVLSVIELGISDTALNLIIHCLKTARINPSAAAYNLIYSKWLDGVSSEQFQQIIETIMEISSENAAVTLDLLGFWHHLDKPFNDKLTEYVWRSLESDPELNRQEPWWYEVDEMAAHLAERNPERALNLICKLLVRENQDQRWNPIESPGRHRFWNVLYQYDKATLLTRVFKIAEDDEIRAIGILHDLKKILDQEDAQNILVQLAESSAGMAALVAESITSEKSGFLPLAEALLNIYPADEKIRSKLALNIAYPVDVITGSEAQYFDKRREALEKMLNDSNATPVLRDFFRELIDRFKQESARQAVWEYDLNVNDLRRYIEDKKSPQRTWAIGRVLKYASLKDIQRLLNIEDIAEVLPQVDLPDKKRRTLERALEVWLHAV